MQHFRSQLTEIKAIQMYETHCCNGAWDTKTCIAVIIAALLASPIVILYTGLWLDHPCKDDKRF